MLLEENQAKNPGFASLALLEFPSEGSFEHWSKDEAAKIQPPLTYKREDVIVHGEVYPRDSNKSVFLVNTYKLLVPPERYGEFVKGYILPNMLDQKARQLLAALHDVRGSRSGRRCAGDAGDGVSGFAGLQPPGCGQG